MSHGRDYNGTDGKAGEDKIRRSARTVGIDVKLHSNDMTGLHDKGK